MSILDEARAVRKIIETAMTKLDDEVASQVSMLSPRLKGNGDLISAGTRIVYNGVLKKATVDLWDTAENNPDNAPVLWEDVLYKEGIRIIPDIITTTSVFNMGELGWWHDELYESLISSNAYVPDQYPAGWKKIIGNI